MHSEWLFVLLLKGVHYFQTKSKGVTTQMKALNESILMALFMLVRLKLILVYLGIDNWAEVRVCT